MKSHRELSRLQPFLVVMLAAAAGFFWFGLFEQPEPDQIPPSAFQVRVRLQSLEEKRPRALNLRSSAGFDLSLQPSTGTSYEHLATHDLVLSADVDESAGSNGGDQPMLAVLLPDGRRSPRISLRSREKGGMIELEGRKYTGELEINVEGDKGEGSQYDIFLRSTLTLPVEHYLAGVIGPEISPRAAMPALKAQAIAARSWVLHRMAHKVLIVDTASSQVFEGLAHLDRRVISALRHTAGEFLTMDGERPLLAFYHSTCGGHTANSDEVFDKKESDRIPGVASPDCEGTTHYRWSYTLDREQCSKLAEQLVIGKRLIAVQAKRQDSASGRWVELRLQGDLGERSLTARQFKTVCRACGLPPPKDFLWHDVNFSEEAGLAVIGGGFGNGVGMCQMCARSMGDRNVSHEDILARFYPGATIRRLSAEPAR